MASIYRIQNIVNGKFYIGSAKNFNRRASEHFSALKHNKHHNKYLQASYNKYGKYAFVIGEVENIEYDLVKYVEESYIKFLNPDYNLTTRTDGPDYWKGKKRSKATRLKISKALKGKSTGRRGISINMSDKGRETNRNTCINFKPRLGTSKYGQIVRIKGNNRKVYADVGEACRDLGLDTQRQSHIIRAIKESHRTAYGYKWSDQVKEGELMETLETDNHELSLDRDVLESATTRDRD